jgi:hypothetical protein
MNCLYFICIFSLIVFSTYAQKPIFDLKTYKDWPEINGAGITSDGKFAYYYINNQPINQETLVVCSTEGGWKRQFINLTEPIFSPDGLFLFGKLEKDTLLIYNLYSGIEKKIAHIIQFKPLSFKNKKNALICTDVDNGLRIWSDNFRISFDLQTKGPYTISPSGLNLLYSKDNKLIWLDLSTGHCQEVFQGNIVENPVFNTLENKVAFFCRENRTTSIYYYKWGDKNVRKIIDDSFSQISSGLQIDPAKSLRFSVDGNRLFFVVNEQLVSNSQNVKNSDLEIWSFEDAYLKSAYYENPFSSIQRHFLCNIELNTGQFLQLTHNAETVFTDLNFESDTLIIGQSSFGFYEERWNASAHISYFICNTKTAEKTIFASNLFKPLNHIQVSPKGTHIIYYDPNEVCYLSFEISSQKKKKLTKSISPEDLGDYSSRNSQSSKGGSLGILGWLDNESVLIQGEFDLWKINTNNKYFPKNITENFGYYNKTVLTPLRSSLTGIIYLRKKIILTAFNTVNKEYGFYLLNPNSSEKLTKLSSHLWYTGEIKNCYTELATNDFIKASTSNTFIFRMQTPTSAPNYFISSDLVKFRKLSACEPQANVNWLTAELHNYYDTIGSFYQGILYKPENFDSTKLYPIIFSVYELKSNLLYSYPSPRDFSGECNIPFLVSNGYLVFLPDIKKPRMNHLGDDIMLSMKAATNHLKQFAYINQQKMGVIGGSTGGYETNYIITHTNIFAAAISSAGISDFVSQATSLRYGSAPIDRMSAYMLGGKPFDIPDVYVTNSPIFAVDKIVTPLLLMHNFSDNAVNYRHSQSFFITLRSLQKKVWWLNYKNEGHGLGSVINQMDFHEKSLQFWDYYLRDKVKPMWMTNHLSIDSR